MFFPLRCCCAAAAALGITTAVAPAADPTGRKERIFAGTDLVKLPRAIAVDNLGRVFVSESARSYGHGIIEAPRLPPALQIEDRQIFTIPAREAALKRWASAGAFDAFREKAGLTKDDPQEAFLTRSSETVVCLTDADGDGRADQRAVYADGFNAPADGPAGAVFPVSPSRVLFGCPPFVWRLDDADLNLRAESRYAVLPGLGLRSGDGSGIAGFAPGMDGYVYFAVSDRGFSTEEWTGRHVRGQGTGAVFRCRPDGSEAELVARGLRRPLGLAFDASDNLFALDTDPVNSAATRLLLVLPGADFGWQADYDVLPERGPWKSDGLEATADKAAGDPARAHWHLPALAVLPGKLTGMLTHPGGLLPIPAGTDLLATDGGLSGAGGGLLALRMERSGSAYKLGESLSVDIRGAWHGAAFAPDGRLFFIDAGPGEPSRDSPWQIKTLAYPAGAAASAGTAALLAEDLTKRNPREVVKLLEHGDRRVRLAAQEAISQFPFTRILDTLVNTARRSTMPAARIHALHAIGALSRGNRSLLTEVAMLFGSDDAAVRGAAARVAGRSGYAGSIDPLAALLYDPEPSVRREAALALGGLPAEAAFARIVQALADNPADDPFLRHALVRALNAAADTEDLVNLVQQHGSPAVRLASVLALRLRRAPELAAVLETDDDAAAAEAARAIRDEEIIAANPALIRQLSRLSAKPARAPVLFRALEAALESGRESDAALVAEVAGAPAESGIPAAWRLAALGTLSVWDTPPEHDRLSGKWRKLPARPAGLALAALRRCVAVLESLNDPSITSRLSAIKPLLGEPDAAALAKLITDSARPEFERRRALASLASIQSGKAVELAGALLQPAVPPLLRSDARILLARRDPKSGVNLLLEAIATATPPERQAAVTALDAMHSREAEAALARLGTQLLDRSLPVEVRVEVLEAVLKRDKERRTAWHRIQEAWYATLRTGENPLARWEVTIGYGDPEAGRLVFESAEARCTECHAVHGRGGTRGPDLESVGRLSAEQLLRAIVLPSAEIAHGQGRADVTLKTGRVLSGIVRHRDESGLLLLTPDGPETLPMSEIQEVSELRSPMPPAGEILTLRELRDLIAWLGTLGPD